MKDRLREGERELGRPTENREHQIFGDLIRKAADVVDTYGEMLKDDRSGIGRLGYRSQENLGRTLDEVDELSERMRSWSADPSALDLIGVRSEVDRDGKKVSLTLRAEQDEELPTSYEDAVFQLKVQCTMSSQPGLTYTDELAAQAYAKKGRHLTTSNTPEAVVVRAYDRTPPEVQLEIDAEYVYVNPRTERVKFENGPGVEISMLNGGGVVARGVGFVGTIRHRTDAFEHPGIDRPLIEGIRDELTDANTLHELSQRATDAIQRRRRR